jgi:hypothetical protein
VQSSCGPSGWTFDSIGQGRIFALHTTFIGDASTTQGGREGHDVSLHLACLLKGVCLTSCLVCRNIIHPILLLGIRHRRELSTSSIAHSYSVMCTKVCLMNKAELPDTLSVLSCILIYAILLVA